MPSLADLLVFKVSSFIGKECGRGIEAFALIPFLFFFLPEPPTKTAFAQKLLKPRSGRPARRIAGSDGRLPQGSFSERY